MLTIIASMEQELAGLRRGLRKLDLAPDFDTQPPPPLWGRTEVGSITPILTLPHLGGREGLSSSSKMLCGKPPGERNPYLPIELQVVGIGGARAAARLRPLLARRSVLPAQSTGGILLLGFCGALDESLTTGDLVLSPRYYRAVQGDYVESDQRMRATALAAAADAGLRPGQGDSLTVDHLVATSEEKRVLRQEYPVGTVNMEDYWVAAAARDEGVPFLAVRAVLDLSTQCLPSYLPGMSRSPFRAALSAGAMPWRVPTLVGLARQMRAAQQTLTRFALSFIDCQRSMAGSGPIAKAESRTL